MDADYGKKLASDFVKNCRNMPAFNVPKEMQKAFKAAGFSWDFRDESKDKGRRHGILITSNNRIANS